MKSIFLILEIVFIVIIFQCKSIKPLENGQYTILTENKNKHDKNHFNSSQDTILLYCNHFEGYFEIMGKNIISQNSGQLIYCLREKHFR